MSASVIWLQNDMRKRHSLRLAPSGRRPMTRGLAKNPQWPSWMAAAAPSRCTASVKLRNPGRISGRIHSSWPNALPS